LVRSGSAWESYPCDAINLLDELEEGEAVARTQFERVAALEQKVAANGRRLAELQDMIRRAIRDLS
jgi:hypothetical protein